MHFPYYILAHGGLGWWDELAFLGIIMIFVGIMIWVWFRSRGDDFAETDLMPPAENRSEDESGERFELE